MPSGLCHSSSHHPRPLGVFAARVPDRLDSRLHTLTYLLCVTFSLLALPLSAAEVVIVRSSDAEPYLQTDTAVAARLKDLRIDARDLTLKELTEKGTAGVEKAAAVVAIGTPAARWLQKQLPEKVKLVYCMVPNPGEAGMLTGRATRGVTTEMGLADQVKLIAETLPATRVVGTLFRNDTPEGAATLQQLKNAIPPEWRVEATAVNEYPSVAAAIDALTQKNPDVIWSSADQKIYDTASVRTLLLAALRKRIPAWGFSAAFVRAGALIGVGVEPKAQGLQAADIVSGWLDEPTGGREAAQPPREFQIAVNLIVARQIGIEIPESVLRRSAFIFRAEK